MEPGAAVGAGAAGVATALPAGLATAGLADAAGAAAGLAAAMSPPRPRPRRDLGAADIAGLFSAGNEERLPDVDARRIGDFVRVDDILGLRVGLLRDDRDGISFLHRVLHAIFG